MSVFTGGVCARELTDVIGIGVTLNPNGSILTITGPTWEHVTTVPASTPNAGSFATRSNGTLYIFDGAVWTAIGGASGWTLADDVVGQWGSGGNDIVTSSLISASNRWDLLSQPISAATAIASTAMRIRTGSTTITGAVAGGASGDIGIQSGDTDSTNAGGTGGDSGATSVTTGDANSTLGTSGNSGDIPITTGDSADGNSGSIILSPGAAPSGIAGSVQAIGRLTTTDDVPSGTVRVVGGLANRTTAASAAITNTTTETAFSTGVYTIPANTLKMGSQIRISLWGSIPSSFTTDTITLRVRLGAAGVAGQVVLFTSAVDTANGNIFFVNITISVRTAGASGTMVAGGSWGMGNNNVDTVRINNMASAAINTTLARDLTCTGQWNFANAANQIILDGFSVWID